MSLGVFDFFCLTRRIYICTLSISNFNHEATDGEQPTDSEEDEDKWGYTGCAEMLKTGRGASFTWPHLRAAV